MEILLLKPDQITREILNLLCQLASTKKLTITEAKSIIERQIKKDHYTYIMYKDGIPIGIGSLILSERLIHSGSIVAEAEDIAIHKNYHGLGYGKILLKHLIKIAKRKGAYKLILCCSDENIGFYLKVGMTRYHNQMRIDLK